MTIREKIKQRQEANLEITKIIILEKMNENISREKYND